MPFEISDPNQTPDVVFDDDGKVLYVRPSGLSTEAEAEYADKVDGVLGALGELAEKFAQNPPKEA